MPSSTGRFPSKSPWHHGPSCRLHVLERWLWHHGVHQLGRVGAPASILRWHRVSTTTKAYCVVVSATTLALSVACKPVSHVGKNETQTPTVIIVIKTAKAITYCILQKKNWELVFVKPCRFCFNADLEYSLWTKSETTMILFLFCGVTMILLTPSLEIRTSTNIILWAFYSLRTPKFPSSRFIAQQDESVQTFIW